MKKTIDQLIKEIDELAMEYCGVDLAKQDRKQESQRKVFQGLYYNTEIVKGQIVITKSEMRGLVH